MVVTLLRVEREKPGYLDRVAWHKRKYHYDRPFGTLRSGP
jgi:hypothetical protein